MTDGHFDYDAVSYVVSTQAAYRDYYPSYYSAGYGWSWPYRYGFGSCYDAFFYDPFYCGSYYNPVFHPFFFGGVRFPLPAALLVPAVTLFSRGGRVFYPATHQL